jgi:hypothetical protein
VFFLGYCCWRLVGFLWYEFFWCYVIQVFSGYFLGSVFFFVLFGVGFVEVVFVVDDVDLGVFGLVFFGLFWDVSFCHFTAFVYGVCA